MFMALVSWWKKKLITERINTLVLSWKLFELIKSEVLSYSSLLCQACMESSYSIEFLVCLIMLERGDEHDEYLQKDTDKFMWVVLDK